MPRRSRHGHPKAAPAATLVEPATDESQRRERAKVFERTKMCKFHILGCCSRGSACHFAHTKEELMSQPDLARTKLCKTLISTGQCTDPECRYAHSKEELRLVLGFNCPGGAGTSPGPALITPASAGATGPAQQEHWDQDGCMLQPAALQHAAMQQLAEAAQAHAAEALRLKAMAACLQVQGAGFPPQFAVAPFVATAPGCGFPGPVVPLTAGSQLGQGLLESAVAGAGTGTSAPNSGRAQRGRGERGSRGKGRGGAAQEKDAPVGHLPRGVNMFRQPGVHSSLETVGTANGFQLGSSSYIGQVSTESDGGSLASAVMDALDTPDAFTPSEPAQIHPLSLRSLSNCSLVDMAKADSDGQCASQTGPQLGGQSHQDGAAADGAGLGWTVKNTFLDFEATSSPTPGRLRTICSAAGRLNALAERSASTSPELGPQDEPAELELRGLGRQQLPTTAEDPDPQPALLAEKRAQDTPLAVGQAPPRAAATTASPQWPAGQLAGCGAAMARTAAAGNASRAATRAAPPAVDEAGETQAASSETESNPGPSSQNGQPAAASGATAGVAQMPLAEGITVKNTFLDFAAPDRATLRAVQTAAGRLDLLGQEDDEED